MQWLRFARAGNPPASWGHKRSCCFKFSISTPNRVVSCVKLKKSSNVLFDSEGQSHSREYDMIY